VPLLYFVKALHILSAMIFLGTGMGSAWIKFRADRCPDIRVVAWAQQEIVRADWIFTVPAGLSLPLTGLWLAWLYRLPLTTPWVLMGVAGFAVAGLCWLPAAYLQIRMRRTADAALAAGAPLPESFVRDRLWWTLLGIPSFSAAVLTVWVMVAKPHWSFLQFGS